MENKTAFLEIFGDSPILRVLDFLVVNEEFDYSMTDIANLSGVGYSTLKLFLGRLEEEEVMICTRTVGKAKMYKLNLANPVIKKFREFYWETTRHHVHEKVREKEITIKH
jgi:transposase